MKEATTQIKDIKLANLGKRAFSYFLDLLFIVFLCIPFYLPVIEGYIDIGFHITDKLNEVKEIQLDSKLFFETSSENDTKKEVSYIDATLLQDGNGYFTYDSYKIFLDRLYYFYYESQYKEEVYEFIFKEDNEEYSIEALNEWFYTNVLFIDNPKYYNFKVFKIIDNNKKSNPLLGKDNQGNNVYNIELLDITTYSGISYTRNDKESFSSNNNQFYIQNSLKIFADTDILPGSYHQACIYLRDTKEYSALYLELERIGRYVGYISLLLAGTIYFIFIPLLFKNGETLGMKMMKIGLVSKNDYQVKKIQVFIHHLFNVVEMYLGIFTFFFFYLLDFGLIVFTKNHTSIANYIALTKSIDTKNSVWLVNEEVEKHLIKQVDDKTK